MPDAITALPANDRPVLIDALNVAYWCGNPPSLRLPLTLLAGLLARGQVAQLIFDANAVHQWPLEAALHAELLLHPHIAAQVPAGRTADAALLRAARLSGGCIVSRDHYRDHRRRYRKLIDDPTRLLTGFVRDEQLHLPALLLQLPLPGSAQQAWAGISAGAQ